MELLVQILIVGGLLMAGVFVIGMVQGIIDGFRGESGGTMGPLELRIQQVHQQNEEDGSSFPAFQVEMRGVVEVPQENCPVQFVLHAFDGEGDQAQPVLCPIDELQEENSIAFEWRSDVLNWQGSGGFSVWTPVFSIARELLTFPKKGRCRLTFQIWVVSADDPPRFELGSPVSARHTVYAVAHASRDFVNLGEGYTEQEENRRSTRGLIVELGLHVAGTDGEVASTEARVVKEWMAKALSIFPEAERAEEKSALEGVARAAYSRAAKGQSKLGNIIERMNRVALVQEKYEALELCMDVMAADGVADRSEVEEIDLIARALEIDADTYRKLREQRFAKLDDLGEIGGDFEEMLGVTRNMSSEQIKQQLVAEYRKWNSRASHSDVKVRSRASEMLLLIGEARKKLLDG